VTLYDNATGPHRTTRYPSSPRHVSHRLPIAPSASPFEAQNAFRPYFKPLTPNLEPLISNRKSGIRNLNNHLVFSPFHFSNRKFSAVSVQPRPSSSLPPNLIVTPRLKIRITRAVSAISDFSNRYKTRLLCPRRGSRKASFPFRVLASASLCLRASVANLCDNGWLN
jgi:hypothetical protein